ncbi:MAG: glycosyltransferase family 2 protein [Polyangiaceae bacterium]
MPDLMLSAVIICYKDEPAIPQMHARLTAVFSSLRVGYEIIFVNDGSPDDAASVLKVLTLQDPHVIAIEHARNFGSQNAFLSGMQVATGDAVVLLDGDLQDPPELIAEFYAKWREGNQVVYGRRAEREGSALLALCCRVFYRIFRAVSSVPMPLDAGDFALMDRVVVSELLALPEADQFLRGLRAWVGFKQVGVDYVRPQRPFGRSTHSWFANLWWAKKAIVSFSFAPLELLGYAAGALTLLACAAVVYQGVDILRHPELPHGISTLIVLIAFFGSLNLLAVALVGEYLSKIFEESKRRPKFIRKAIRHDGRLFTPGAEIEEFVRVRVHSAAARRALRGNSGGGNEG